MSDKSKISIAMQTNLYELLQQKKMSVEELSRRSGVSRGNIYYVLRGTSGITFDTLERFCKALGVDPNTLLGYEEK